MSNIKTESANFSDIYNLQMPTLLLHLKIEFPSVNFYIIITVCVPVFVCVSLIVCVVLLVLVRYYLPFCQPTNYDILLQ